MVKSEIIIGHIISEKGIEVDKAKKILISKLPPPKTVWEVRSFLGHARPTASLSRTFLKFSNLCVTF